MSRWTLKTTTWSGSVVATAWMKSPSSGDGKRSGDMSSRRSVMLWVSISSVMMVTRSAHWAVTLCTPSVEGDTSQDPVWGGGPSHRPVQGCGEGPAQEPGLQFSLYIPVPPTKKASSLQLA